VQGQARSLGRGPLTPGLVISHALGMLRFGFRRIALVVRTMRISLTVLPLVATLVLARPSSR